MIVCMVIDVKLSLLLGISLKILYCFIIQEGNSFFLVQQV